MKNLFHSKVFRKNLIKWLCMYGGVMCCLTIMVTYSRYMSEMSVSDSARPAKFNIGIEEVACPAKDQYCYDPTNTTSLRPSDKVTFYFAVNTSELEVSTLLTINLTIHNKDNLFSYKVSENSEEYKNPELHKVTIRNNEAIREESIGKFTITRDEPNEIIKFNTEQNIDMTNLTKENVYKTDIVAGNRQVYQIVLPYDYKKNGYTQPKTYDEIIEIGYSAKQKD